VETCAAESWSPTLEVSLELVPREFRFETTANEGLLGKSAIRCRAAVGEVPLPFIFARPSSARSPDSGCLIRGLIVATQPVKKPTSGRYENVPKRSLGIGA
jgi:hypothetical protein